MKKVIILGAIAGLVIYSCSTWNADAGGKRKGAAGAVVDYEDFEAGQKARSEKDRVLTDRQAPETEKKDEITMQTDRSRGVVYLNKESFLKEVVDYETNPNEWIYKGELPAVIDFYADWCRPCQITSPIIDELAKEYAGKIQFFKIDVQNEQELAMAFGIQSIPSFLYIPMDDKPVMAMGIANTPEATKALFKRQIEEVLLN